MHVIGLKDPTPEYLSKLRAYQACRDAEVDPPKELSRYFEDMESPEETGMEVEIGDLYDDGGAVKEWQSEYREGLEVDLSKLPPGVTRVRFYCSY